MVINETNDLKMLKKMQEVAELHIKRCLDEESDDYNPNKASDLQLDLLRVNMRIEDLTVSHRYFVKHKFGPWTEVTKSDYVCAERSAGFRNKYGLDHEPATAAFSNDTIEGKIKYAKQDTDT